MVRNARKSSGGGHVGKLLWLGTVRPSMVINKHDHQLRWRSRSAAATKSLVHCPRTMAESCIAL